jgi:hypothetical protein
MHQKQDTNRILTKRDRKQISIFKRKVYRRILAPVYEMKKEIGEY